MSADEKNRKDLLIRVFPRSNIAAEFPPWMDTTPTTTNNITITVANELFKLLYKWPQRISLPYSWHSQLHVRYG